MLTFFKSCGMKNLLAGLAGAIALNVLHELYRHYDKEAPEVQLIGEEALSKIAKAADIKPPKGEKLYAYTLAADVVSNGLYYSMIGIGKSNYITKAILLGTAAGVGALKLTKPLGLNDKPIKKTGKTKLLTVVWYTSGALVTALTLTALNKRNKYVN